LGQTSPTGPSRGFRDTEAVPAGRRRPAVDPRRVPRASRSAPSDVAASLVRRSLRVVFTNEVFRRPAVRAVRRPPGDFHRLRRPLRVLALVPSPTMPGRIAPPGVPRPFSDINQRDPYHPGLPHPALSVLGVSHPHDGLLSLRPCGHAGSAAAPGVSTRGSFRTVGPRRVAASAAPSHPRCSSASNSEEYEVASSAGSKALEPTRPGSVATVPGLTSAPSKHIIPRSSQRLSPPLFPSHA